MRAYTLLCLSLVASACSVLVDASRDQCASEGECGAGFTCASGICVAVVKDAAVEDAQGDDVLTEDAAPPEPDVPGLEGTAWACVDNVEIPTPEEDVEVILHVANLVFQPRVGVTARACDNLDINCSNPIAEGLSDEEGLIRLTVPPTYTGYVEMTHPETISVISMTDAAQQMYVTQGEIGPVMQIPTTDEVEVLLRLATGSEMAFDTSRGGVLMLGQACKEGGASQTNAEGVEFHIVGTEDETIINWYYENNLPTQNRSVTNEIGSGGFINVPEGIFDAEMRLPQDEGGHVLGRTSFFTRPGWFTYLIVTPSAVD